MHDVGQLPGQVPVVGLHLIVILLLVLFDQPLVHSQRLAAGVHKLPEVKVKSNVVGHISVDITKSSAVIHPLCSKHYGGFELADLVILERRTSSFPFIYIMIHSI